MAPALKRLRDALAHGRFVSYQPTSLQVRDGQVTSADPQSIRTDLTLLREHFDSLVTYDAVHGTQAIAPIAAQLKFRALIIGVWNPLDDAEVDAALASARKYPLLVVGVSLGNETLLAHRSTTQQLAAVITRVHALSPGLPLSSTEPFHVYEQPAAAGVLAQLDFLLVNVHPVFQGWFKQATDATAAQFVLNVTSDLARAYCGPILIKETGVPTAPAESGFTSARQASFYKELAARLPGTGTLAFAYFAAFDAPWRATDATGVPGPAGPHPEEAHWGLYDAERHPKPVIEQLPALKPQ